MEIDEYKFEDVQADVIKIKSFYLETIHIVYMNYMIYGSACNINIVFLIM